MIIDGLIKESYDKYGVPVTAALENEIDQANIHGWLQERIISVEQRLAFVITGLLEKKVLKKEDIGELFSQNGAETMNELGLKSGSPQDIFTLIFDYMLEGMPCDRVNEMIESTPSMISWKTTRCLHKDYWEQCGGDINNFYFFRDSWIQGFLSANGEEYKYARLEDNIRIIRRV